MSEIVHYSFLSWTQFFIVAAILVGAMLIANRFHLFSKHTWKTSIAYHMFFCVLITIMVIAFLLVRPVFHLLLLLVFFGFIYKNIFAYLRSIFNLYYSKIHIGDRVRINKTEGRLDSINIGGMHIIANDEKTYFPFNNWKGEKIVLLSENGKVPVSFEVKGQKGRSQQETMMDIQKVLFQFPYLSDDDVDIKLNDKDVWARVHLSSEDYKESLLGNLTKAGFEFNKKSKK